MIVPLRRLTDTFAPDIQPLIYQMETSTKLTKIEKELIRIQDRIIMFPRRLIVNNI